VIEKNVKNFKANRTPAGMEWNGVKMEAMKRGGRNTPKPKPKPPAAAHGLYQTKNGGGGGRREAD
jgi:hypothetical protein